MPSAVLTPRPVLDVVGTDALAPLTTGGTVPMADLDRAMAAQFGRAPH